MIRRGVRGPWRVGLAVAGLCLAASALQAQDEADAAVLRGRVVGRQDAAVSALPYAVVELRLASGVRSALTDRDGRFVFEGVPAGAGILRAHYLGHRARAVEVVVAPARDISVDLELTYEAVPIPGITVVARTPFTISDPDGPGPLRPASAGADVELALLTLSPGLAETAVGAGRGGSGGGQDPADPRHILLMRGSTADLKLVLLDGAPVYTPFHLGGLLESFDTGVLGAAAHHVGGAPARYDGGLSYILDLETRRPGLHGTHGHLAADLMSARGSAETAIGGVGVLAAGRGLHNGGPRLLEGSSSPYGYADGLVRGSLPVGSGLWSVTAFGNREEVRLGATDTPLLPEAARWGNGLLSTRFEHEPGATRLTWTLAASRYEAELPLRSDSAGFLNPVLARGETTRQRATLEGERPTASGVVRFGAVVDRTLLHYSSRLLTRDGVLRTDTRSDGWVAGVHGEVQHALGEQVQGRIGLRADRFDPGGVRSALRGSVAWSVSERAVLSLSSGRYHQLTRGTEADVESALVPEPGTPVQSDDGTLMDVATADHLVLGLDQSLTDEVRLGLRGFVKRFEGVGEPDRSLTSSGVDLRLDALSGARQGWIGYALSWSWEADPAVTVGTDRFTGRHLLTAGYRGPVSGPLGLDVRLSFSDGLPYTEIALGAAESGPADAQRVLDEQPALGGDPDSFFRADVELYGEWTTSLGGQEGRLRPYLRLINALDRRDALFYYFEPWRNPDLEPLAQRPVLPVVGVSWAF